MTAITLPANNLFSVITTGERKQAPSWKSLLNLPQFGDAHIDYAADTDAQRNLWATRLDEAVRQAERPVLLVASGASCFATVWWARLSPRGYVSRVAGALLFNPIDPAIMDAAGRFASPRTALPFPSAVVERTTRRGELKAQVLALAEGWGSGLLDVSADQDRLETGGAWQHAHALLARATARVVERRMRAADALLAPSPDRTSDLV
jgi:predicted alpha/beta hydrolase family esterase